MKLRFLYGLSAADIAPIYNVNPRTVYRWLGQAIERIYNHPEFWCAELLIEVFGLADAGDWLYRQRRTRSPEMGLNSKSTPLSLLSAFSGEREKTTPTPNASEIDDRAVSGHFSRGDQPALERERHGR